MKRLLCALCLLALLLTGCARRREINFRVDTGSRGALLTVVSGTDDAQITLSGAQRTIRVRAARATLALQPDSRYLVSIRTGEDAHPTWTLAPLP